MALLSASRSYKNWRQEPKETWRDSETAGVLFVSSNDFKTYNLRETAGNAFLELQVLSEEERD